ncbi:MAG: hypothetical protein FJ100_16765 [Deltaproteobacteria bacterium]|nr:hypothetical protein [Deltaproteobacteria bacterium]
MKQHFWLARVTIQADAPLHIGTGAGDGLRDALYVRGMGGLPFLPATSLAGVLRAVMQASAGCAEDQARIVSLFGSIDAPRDNGSSQRARASRLFVSAGHVQDQRGVPRGLDDKVDSDPILSLCAAGATRDHVAISGAGVADGRGKYDWTSVPRGARFSFDLRIDGDGDRPVDPRDVAAAKAALAGMRMGAKTRSGLGRLTVKEALCSERYFDLGKSEDRELWRTFTRRPAELVDKLSGAANWTPSRHEVHQRASSVQPVTLRLQAQDYLLVGQGVPQDDLDHHWNKARSKARAKLPITERCIEWKTDKAAALSEVLPLVPASGIKGALRHRTLFHLRRLAGTEVDQLPGEALADLFGSIKRGEDGDEDGGGQAGLVFIDDVWLPRSALTAKESSGALTHVSLDRFTGGPLLGALFGEAPLYRPELKVRIAVLGRPADQSLRKAFIFALRDLLEGRLALGTGRNAGHGFCTGDVKQLGEFRRWVEG